MTIFGTGCEPNTGPYQQIGGLYAKSTSFNTSLTAGNERNNTKITYQSILNYRTGKIFYKCKGDIKV